MEAIFEVPGCRVRQCTWITRDAEPLPSPWEPVRERRSRRMEWCQPREAAYGIVWEVPA